VKKTDPQRAGLFFVDIISYFWNCKLELMVSTMLRYTPPEAELLLHVTEYMLAASGFDADDNTELLDYEYGGLL